MNMNNEYLKYSILGFFILVVISLVLCLWWPFLSSFRIVFGAVYLLLIPGFIWSWVFWKKDDIKLFERFVLSPVLSLAIVPLVIFLLSKVNIKINIINSIWETFVVIILGVITIIFKKRHIFSKLKYKLFRTNK